MQVISECKKNIVLSTILAVVIIIGLAVSAIWIAPKNTVPGGDLVARRESQLAVQLTDPPTVPVGTNSLNMTYSELVLQVAGQNSLSTSNLTIIPAGDSKSVDLMKLENIS